MLASTVIHEALHGFINRERILLSPAQFASKYPLFASGTSPNDGAHEVMAARYFSAMISDLTTIYPELKPEAASLLTWGGLQDTNLFANEQLSNLGFLNDVANMESIASDCVNHTTAEREALGIRRCGG